MIFILMFRKTSALHATSLLSDLLSSSSSILRISPALYMLEN